METNNNDDSAAGGQQQSSVTDHKRKKISNCLKHLTHAIQCRDADCRDNCCYKTKRIVQHARQCKLKNTKDGCIMCKHLTALYCYHAKHCQEPVCPFPICSTIKNKLARQQQLRLNLTAEAQDLRNRVIAMQNRRLLYGSNCFQQNLKSSNPPIQPSCATQSHSAFYPQHSDAKSSSGPPLGALLAVQQVQAAAARQAAQASMPQMMSGIPNHMMNASWGNSGCAQNQQFHQNTQLGMQAMEGSNSEPNSTDSVWGSTLVMSNPGPSVAGMQRSAQDWQQLFQTLRISNINSEMPASSVYPEN